MMDSFKRDVSPCPERLPEDCSLEDIQYHLYVIDKVRNGLQRGDTEGVIEQDEAEARMARWIIE